MIGPTLSVRHLTKYPLHPSEEQNAKEEETNESELHQVAKIDSRDIHLSFLVDNISVRVTKTSIPLDSESVHIETRERKNVNEVLIEADNPNLLWSTKTLW